MTIIAATTTTIIIITITTISMAIIINYPCYQSHHHCSALGGGEFRTATSKARQAWQQVSRYRDHSQA